MQKVLFTAQKLQLLVKLLESIYPIPRLKLHATMFFDVIRTEMEEYLHVLLCMIYVLIKSTVMRNTEDIPLYKTKQIFVGRIYIPPNNINFEKFFDKHLVSTLIMKYFCLVISI